MQRITLFGVINENSVTQLEQQLTLFDRNLPLQVEINSDGGSVSHGVTIFSLLQRWPGGVETIVAGWALSIASLIAQAGARRLAHSTAALMVHAPWVSARGNSYELREQADTLDKVLETMLSGYRRSGRSDAEIREWFDGKDHWFTAEEALAEGLIDEIISSDSSVLPANAQAALHSVPVNLMKVINSMNTTTNKTFDAASVAAAAVRAEAKRRDDICAGFSSFLAGPGVAELQRRCENDTSISAEVAGKMLLAHLGSQAVPIAGAWSGDYDCNSFGASSDGRLNSFQAAAQDVLLMRAGIKVSNPHPAIRDIQNMSIATMAEKMLSMQGKSADIKGRGNSSDRIISAALSTSDLPALLANTANRAMREGYESAPSGHILFTGEREVSDFKPQTLVNLSEAPGLQKVEELGEYKSGSLSDSASTFKVETFGRVMSISRQALVNDDLGAFTRLPQSFGFAARRLEADLVYGMLTEESQDGVDLFSTERGNLGTAAALSIESLGAARAAMRKQKGIASLGYIDPQPKYLIVPVSLETKAEQLLASLVDPARSNDTPNLSFIRGLQLIADPRLDASSETAWYLSAGPEQIDGILRAYLAGQPRPELEEDSEFVRDALSFKVRLDFGVGVVDYRALYKNPGQ